MKYETTREELLRPLRDRITEADRRPIEQLNREDDLCFLEYVDNLGKEPGHDDAKN